jgi:hypothetical protein
MRSSKLRVPITAEMTVYVLAIALAVSTAAAYRLHGRDLPPEMEFIPRESAILLVSGPIEPLWLAIKDQFGGVIKLPPEKNAQENENTDDLSILNLLLADARDKFKKKMIPMTSVDDVRTAGVDPRFGALVSIYNDDDTTSDSDSRNDSDTKKVLPPFLAVVHVQDRDALELTLKKLKIANVHPEYPQDGIAVITNNTELAARSRDHEGNLRFARQNDDLYEGIRRCLDTPLEIGTHLFMFWRGRSNPPGVRQLSVGIAFNDEGFRMRSLVDIDGGAIKPLDDLIAEPPPSVAWSKPLPANLAGALAVHDNALGSLIETAGSLRSDFQDALEDNYGGLLWELRNVSGLNRVVVGATGYRHGLPDLLISLWGDTGRIREILLNMRLDFRRKRDTEILAAAFKRYPGIVDAKVRLRLLPEANSTFGRYKVTPDGKVTGQPAPEDFNNELYSMDKEGVRVDFVAPRPTANDRAFRKAFKKMTQKELKDTDALDRYRIAYVVRDGVVWIATDARDIARSASGDGGLPDSPNFQTASSRWKDRDKLELFLDIDRMSTLGMLSPEKGASSFVKYLGDLRDHPAVELQVVPCPLRRQCVALDFRAFRRGAIR